MQIEDDLLHPNPANEKKKHKLKRLVQAPNSFFMDVKCPGCFNMLVSLLVSCLQIYEYGHVFVLHLWRCLSWRFQHIILSNADSSSFFKQHHRL